MTKLQIGDDIIVMVMLTIALKIKIRYCTLDNEVIPSFKPGKIYFYSHDYFEYL